MAKKVDDADLQAFADSFDSLSSSSENDFVGMLNPLTCSPVKRHNRQFEEDFDVDISEDWDVSSDSVGIKISEIAQKIQSSSPALSKIRLSQLASHSTKKQKLEDLEQIFMDDTNEASQGRTISISAPETSSPTYHRTETLYPQIKPRPFSRTLSTLSHRSTNDSDRQNVKVDIPFCSQLNDTVLREENLTFVEISRSNDLLYPTMNSYEQEYSSKKEQSPIKPSSQPSVAEQMKMIIEKSKNSEFGAPFQPGSSSGLAMVSSLMKRAKMPNPQLLLLTQKANINSVDQIRQMSTERSKPKVVQTLILSEEQQHVVDLVKRGKSLFYTGSAGTGKSVLLKSLIKTLKDIYRIDGDVAVTASTGLAAVNVGGITLHSFAGIGLGKEDADQLVKKIRRNRKALNRWKNIRVLIIDEISMISGELFDKLDHIACELRKNDQPFGGIQVICCGDFFQLPPVSTDEERSTFCFNSDAWKRSMKLTITLQKVFRQKGDLEFIDMLNDMRLGIVSPESSIKFRALERELPKAEVEPAELYSTRIEVDRANNLRLNNLTSETMHYNAIDGGVLTDQHQRQRLLANFMAPEKLELKKGAQVMMIKNLDESLVNGSLGKVIDFMDRDTYLSFERLKTEGLDERALEMNIEAAKAKAAILEENKQAVEEPTEKLEDTIFDFLKDVKTDDPDMQRSIESKIKLMNDLHLSSRGQKLPLVRFLTPDNQSRVVLVNPETWVVEDERQTPLVTRMQLPLLLAWALSIHKSQGQTLPRVRVNLKKVFEKGQAYVAISRAVSRDGLQILNFHESKVFAHPKVVEFYQNLSSAEDAKLLIEDELEVAKPVKARNNRRNYAVREREKKNHAEFYKRHNRDEDELINKKTKRRPTIPMTPDRYSETIGRIGDEYM
jgi:ATP-dependent DNA helicase PIF1